MIAKVSRPQSRPIEISGLKLYMLISVDLLYDLDGNHNNNNNSLSEHFLGEELHCTDYLWFLIYSLPFSFSSSFLYHSISPALFSCTLITGRYISCGSWFHLIIWDSPWYWKWFCRFGVWWEKRFLFWAPLQFCSIYFPLCVSSWQKNLRQLHGRFFAFSCVVTILILSLHSWNVLEWKLTLKDAAEGTEMNITRLACGKDLYLCRLASFWHIHVMRGRRREWLRYLFIFSLCENTVI